MLRISRNIHNLLDANTIEEFLVDRIKEEEEPMKRGILKSPRIPKRVCSYGHNL